MGSGTPEALATTKILWPRVTGCFRIIPKMPTAKERQKALGSSSWISPRFHGYATKGTYQSTVSELHQGSKIACTGAFLVFQTHGMKYCPLNCRPLAAVRAGSEVYIHLSPSLEALLIVSYDQLAKGSFHHERSTVHELYL